MCITKNENEVWKKCSTSIIGSKNGEVGSDLIAHLSRSVVAFGISFRWSSHSFINATNSTDRGNTSARRNETSVYISASVYKA